VESAKLESVENSNKHNKFLLPLLFFILMDEVCNNFIFNQFLRFTHKNEIIFSIIFLLLQIVISPIQAGYSDFYCRKKSLIISLFASSLSVFCVYISALYFYPILFLSIAILIKGFFGNTLPLAWAALADTQTRNFRFSLGLSTSAIAFGYLTLIFIGNSIPELKSNLLILFIFLLLTLLCTLFFVDIRDKSNNEKFKNQNKSIIREIKLIINDFLKNGKTIKALATFLFWELSFYSTHFLDVDLKLQKFRFLTLSMASGYVVGVVFLKFLNKNNFDMIKIGYYISTFSPIPVFICYYCFEDLKILMIPCYFLYSLGFAFLVPSLFSILSMERSSHEQGKIYGLIDSTDTIAFLLASIAAMSYDFFHFSPIYILGFSFIVFLISWLPYAKFKKDYPKTSEADL
jgi:MFS family permease